MMPARRIYVTKDEAQAAHAEQRRAWHHKRRARGLCQMCGLAREPGNDGWRCRRLECRAARRLSR